MSLSSSKIAKMGISIALAIALKWVLLQVPNVEPISFVVFSSGYILGAIEGGIVGLLTMLVYSVFNPYGMAPLPVLIAQVISMAFIGLTGGVVAKLTWFSKANTTLKFLAIGAIGLVLTLVYDILTNLAVAYMAGQLIPILIGGIVFSLVHIISNTIIFAVLSPAIFRVKMVLK